MNSHIYIDKGIPLVSLEPETLSDGSKAWNLHFGNRQFDCLDEKRGREAMMMIAAALRHCAPVEENVLHI